MRTPITFLLTCLLCVCTDSAPATRAPDVGSGFALRRAHAHNDYEHQRPLLDALELGFGSVEADVWLLPLGSELYVAHDLAAIRPQRTLRTLYLDPLAQRVAEEGGSVYAGEAFSLQLLVDIKSDAAKTYAALEAQLEPYRALLSCVEHGVLRSGAVTVVLSGNRPYDTLATQAMRCAFHDGRIGDLDSSDPATLMPLISDNWDALFDWRGEGMMPDEQRARLRDDVGRAHAANRHVRFWGTPDAPGTAREAVWAELLAADVDYLNTDDLAGLAAWLRARGNP